ncbi:dihydroorotate dehydrogenase [Bacillus luteolus]|uniref:Dihydroorotate dehydrogenase n=1 Tax=Litchfieldia luteola TaxID=682179 RepID=A0ABR9QGA8_9BACI|nr:dihydroorotate dehydrogenase [Cytobacillus luteolus]MBE4907532.1 dihydroorotate dehydrogenase [Cytobacillus luteolus]MBP1944301.1 dihydroorotate dehydrogenase [Cytobacillus luteolus]
MPDWSYHVLFKPILSKLSPTVSREFIHRGMSRIASVPGGHHFINFLGREESSPALSTEVNGLQLSNVVGLSGKIDPLLSGTKAFSNLGFGFLEVGPVTIEATPMTPPTVMRDEQTIEFTPFVESLGLTKTVDKLENFRKKQPVIVRLSGSTDEIEIMIQEIEPYADAYIIDTREQIEDWNSIPSLSTKPIYIGIRSNQITNHSIEVLDCFSGVVLDEDEAEIDSINLKNHLNAISYLRQNKFTKTVITVGGILEPSDALSLLDATAELVMVSGGYVFSGPGLPKRIKEAQLARIQNQLLLEEKGWVWYFLFGLSILIGGLLALLISITSIILPYDEYFLNMKKETIGSFNNRILFFMAHDRMTLAGTMISGGIVYIALSYYGIRKGLLWAKQATDAAAITGFLGILMFIGYGYLDWLHLLFWIILAPFYVMGFMKTKHLKGTPSSTNRTNHVIWRHSLLGQFLFVVLGFSLTLGGIVISYIGVTTVFIPTDISYICMPPEMLDEFNDKLIPVIAHDRAGFGSALISVGLLILMLSLWGFQQGNKWVWWTLLIGGIPAFISGIAVHFTIGYTTFTHLLPAYFALVLFLLGLIYSYRFFHYK